MPLNVLVKTADMPHEEWLRKRQNGIGGSDIAAVVGMSPWSSPIKVYQAKIGELPNIEESEAMHFGTIFEKEVAKEFERRTGLKVRKKNAILYHSEENKWMVANVDRLVVGRKEGLECKTTNAFAAGEWTSEKVPDQYFLQCQWYMAVTGYLRWHIAVIIGGNHFIHKVIDRDDGLIQMLMEKGKDFWFNHVIPRNPPEIDGSKASTELLKYMYPEGDAGKVIQLPNRYAAELERYDELDQEIERLEAEREKIKNQIKAEMKTAEVARVNNRVITWKTIHSNRFQTSEFKKAHTDLYADYLKSVPQRKLIIKK